MLESVVEARLRRILWKEYSARTVKILMKDWPDRLVLLPNGGHFFIEVKKPGEKPRPAQVRNHRMLRSMGHAVITVDGTDWSVMRRCAVIQLSARSAHLERERATLYGRTH